MLTDQEFQAAMATLNEFKQRAYWNRSRNGNLTREWGTKRVTVFKWKGEYGWSIHYTATDSVSYSEGKYETEQEALDALGLYVVEN